MPTALRVQFHSAEEGVGWVEFGGADADLRRSPPSAGGSAHDVIVLGAAPLSTVRMRAVVEVDGQRHASDIFEAENGQLPISVPLLTVTHNAYPAAAETTLLASIYSNNDDDTVLMATLEGDVFWAITQAQGDAFGLGVQPEAGGLAFNRFRNNEAEGRIDAEIVRTDPWGGVREVIDTPNAHHFFTRPSDGETLWLANEIRNISGYGNIIGDMMMRTRGADSDPVVDLFESLEISREDDFGEVFDWSHANWVTYDPDRGTALMSAGYIDTLLEVELDGTIVDIINGEGAINGDYTFDPPSAAFSLPHGIHWADNGDLLMFAAVSGTVQATRYAVDTQQRVLRQVWSHGADEGLEPSVLGEVQELPDGNLLVSWGGWGRVQIVSPTGALLWEAETDLMELIGQVHLLDSPYF